MSAQSKPVMTEAQYADLLLETARVQLMKYAKFVTRRAFQDGGYERAQAAYAIAIDLKKLRQPEYEAELQRADDERLARAA